MATWKQFILIGLIGLAGGFGFNSLRAGSLPTKAEPMLTQQAGGADTLAVATVKLAMIGFEEADALYRKELAIFVDARDAVDFNKGRIPGAINITPDDFKTGKQKLLVPKGSLVVVYCSGADCETSHDLAKLMADAGFQKVRVYAGGWAEWDAMGQPVER